MTGWSRPWIEHFRIKMKRRVFLTFRQLHRVQRCDIERQPLVHPRRERRLNLDVDDPTMLIRCHLLALRVVDIVPAVLS